MLWLLGYLPGRPHGHLLDLSLGEPICLLWCLGMRDHAIQLLCDRVRTLPCSFAASHTFPEPFPYTVNASNVVSHISLHEANFPSHAHPKSSAYFYPLVCRLIALPPTCFRSCSLWSRNERLSCEPLPPPPRPLAAPQPHRLCSRGRHFTGHRALVQLRGKLFTAVLSLLPR